jgi:signal transduction histidine kinase
MSPLHTIAQAFRGDILALQAPDFQMLTGERGATLMGDGLGSLLATRFRAPNSGLTIGAWGVGFVMVALILWSPYLATSVGLQLAHLVLVSLDSAIALFVAYLVHGRYIRYGALQDFLLTHALVLLAAAELGLAYVSAAGSNLVVELEAWFFLGMRLAGAVLIAWAAISGPRRSRRPVSRQLFVLVPVAIAAVTFVALWTGVRQPLEGPSSGVPTLGTLLADQPAYLPPQVLAVLGFSIAFIVFAVRSTRHDDELHRWLGPALAFAALAGAGDVLSPRLLAEPIVNSELLRAVCYVLLLIGATRETRQYWNTRTHAAVEEDRRRLARELHDGVVQELLYIRSVSRGLTGDGESTRRIVGACDRALDESRIAIQALGRPSDETLGSVLDRMATELAERYHVVLEVDLDRTILAGPTQQLAIMRITGEAISNAVRHGEATSMQLRLSRSGARRRLSIEDDGHGFDVSQRVSDNAGYGLTSMRERAQRLPGSFSVEARPGVGSMVIVEW